MGHAGMREYEKIRQKKQIAIRYLAPESQRELLERRSRERPLFSYRILPNLSEGLVNTSIWNQSVSSSIFSVTQ